MDIPKSVFKVMTVLGGSYVLGLYYLLDRLKQRDFPGFTLYYRENKGPYYPLQKDLIDKDEWRILPPAAEEYFKRDEVARMVVYCDNTEWVKDPNKCREAIGFYVADTVPENVRAELGKGLASVAIPPCKATTIPMWKRYTGFLFQLYMSVLFSEYLGKNASEMVKNRVRYVPFCGVHLRSGPTLFIPEPSVVAKFEVTKAPRPALNKKGQTFVNEFIRLEKIMDEKARKEREASAKR